MSNFAYLVAVLILFVVWVFLFLSKPYRREMIVMSFFFAPFALLDLFFLQDYWSPQTFLGTKFGLETFLFSFSIGGIAAVIYEKFRGLKFARSVGEKSWILGGTVLILFLNFLSLKFVGVNSMYSLYSVFFAAAIFILVRRRDLLMDVVGSGFLFGFLGFFLYLIFLSIYPEIIKDWWKLQNLSGILIAGIPIEELLFAFGFGMVAGPLYEFWQGYRLEGRGK